MTEQRKQTLLKVYAPEYCPNCGNELDGSEDVTTVISNMPLWNVACKLCGSGYVLRIVE